MKNQQSVKEATNTVFEIFEYYPVTIRRTKSNEEIINNECDETSDKIQTQTLLVS